MGLYYRSGSAGYDRSGIRIVCFRYLSGITGQRCGISVCIRPNDTNIPLPPHLRIHLPADPGVRRITLRKYHSNHWTMHIQCRSFGLYCNSARSDPRGNRKTERPKLESYPAGPPVNPLAVAASLHDRSSMRDRLGHRHVVLHRLEIVQGIRVEYL